MMMINVEASISRSKSSLGALDEEPSAIALINIDTLIPERAIKFDLIIKEDGFYYFLKPINNFNNFCAKF